MSTTALRYERHQIAEAKSSIALDRIIGETVTLVKDGPRRKIGICPLHADRSPSLTVFDDGHFHCFGCGAHGDALTWLMKARKFTFPQALDHLGATPPEGRVQITQPTAITSAPSPTLAAAIRCWSEALPARGTIVESYLASRGLPLPEGVAIRFHPECQRGPRDARGTVILAPAMVCLMVDPVSGKSTGVHRTFLTPSGSDKAPPITQGDRVLSAKRILGKWGCIRVPPPNETRGTLGIAEGLENAVSVQVMGWDWGPVWAAGCQSELAAFPVLPWVSSLNIFADGDDVGAKAAETCAARWREAGRHVELHFPPSGHDWNSALREGVR